MYILKLDSGRFAVALKGKTQSLWKAKLNIMGRMLLFLEKQILN